MMESTIVQIKREHQYPGGPKLSRAREMETRNLFNERMSVHRYEKEKALCELADRTGISYAVRWNRTGKRTGIGKDAMECNAVRPQWYTDTNSEEEAEDNEEQNNTTWNDSRMQRMQRTTWRWNEDQPQ